MSINFRVGSVGAGGVLGPLEKYVAVGECGESGLGGRRPQGWVESRAAEYGDLLRLQSAQLQALGSDQCQIEHRPNLQVDRA